LNNYIKNDLLSDNKKIDFLETISNQSDIDYRTLNNIYNKFYDKYSYINKKQRETDKIETISIEKDKYYINNEEVYEEEFDDKFAELEEEHFNLINGLDINPNDFDEDNYYDEYEVNEGTTNVNSSISEQLSLFEPRENQLASKICDIF